MTQTKKQHSNNNESSIDSILGGKSETLLYEKPLTITQIAARFIAKEQTKQKNYEVFNNDLVKVVATLEDFYNGRPFNRNDFHKLAEYLHIPSAKLNLFFDAFIQQLEALGRIRIIKDGCYSVDIFQLA